MGGGRAGGAPDYEVILAVVLPEGHCRGGMGWWGGRAGKLGLGDVEISRRTGLVLERQVQVSIKRSEFRARLDLEETARGRRSDVETCGEGAPGPGPEQMLDPVDEQRR